jgi:O-antigen/teichoic acid export membrane protein
VARYYLFMGIAAMFSVGKGFAYAWLLEAKGFGFYNLVTTVSAYALTIFSAGLIEGLSVRLPAMYGQGQEREVAHLLPRAIARFVRTSLVASSLALICIVAFSLDFRVALLGCLLAVSSGVLMIIVTNARSSGDLSSYGRISVTRALLGMLLGILGGSLAGFAGAIVGEIVAFTVVAMYLWRARSNVVKATRASAQLSLSEICSEGRPLLWHNVFVLLQQGLDRWFVLGGLGVLALGQYSFAMLLMSAALVAHAAVAQHIGPRILRETALGAGLRNSLYSVLRSIGWLSLGFLLAMGVLLGFARSSLAAAFPTYQEGIIIAPIVLVACYFQVTYLLDWVVIAANKTKLLSNLTVSVTLALCVTGLAGIAWGFRIRDYALLMLCGRVAMWLSALIIAVRAVHRSTTN